MKTPSVAFVFFLLIFGLTGCEEVNPNLRSKLASERAGVDALQADGSYLVSGASGQFQLMSPAGWVVSGYKGTEGSLVFRLRPTSAIRSEIVRPEIRAGFDPVPAMTISQLRDAARTYATGGELSPVRTADGKSAYLFTDNLHPIYGSRITALIDEPLFKPSIRLIANSDAERDALLPSFAEVVRSYRAIQPPWARSGNTR